jgi:hypothetical protein
VLIPVESRERGICNTSGRPLHSVLMVYHLLKKAMYRQALQYALRLFAELAPFDDSEAALLVAFSKVEHNDFEAWFFKTWAVYCLNLNRMAFPDQSAAVRHHIDDAKQIYAMYESVMQWLPRYFAVMGKSLLEERDPRFRVIVRWELFGERPYPPSFTFVPLEADFDRPKFVPPFRFPDLAIGSPFGQRNIFQIRNEIHVLSYVEQKIYNLYRNDPKGFERVYLGELR